MNALEVTCQQVADYYGLSDLAAEGKRGEIKRIVQTNLKDGSISDECTKEILFKIFFEGNDSWGRASRHHFGNDGFMFEILAFVVTLVSKANLIVFYILIHLPDPFSIGGMVWWYAGR